MFAVFKREFQSYFLSPIAYIFIGTFIFVSGIFFTLINISSNSASFNQTLGQITFVFMLIVPVLTMRLLSEDRKNKTDQLLLTSPVSLWDIVIGKYLAAVSVLVASLVVSFIFPIIISIFGELPLGEIVAGYIGFFLLGCALISIGLFISSVTENQVIAAILTWFIILFIWVGDYFINMISNQFIANILQWFSLYSRMNIFTYGLLSFTPVMYFISFSWVFVFMTVRSIESRRWSES